ncbi:GGDEF domain-containing protein [Novosphingobium sp. PC22D]|uniref:GGDEF domain-containing protein n=1 Tax=Novosphingobium sp. PC22D TaxID=1962403 RepID=UPI00143A55BB|nr:GGDEF domain-containing protein [Novosphingobium sp. PC22D]
MATLVFMLAVNLVPGYDIPQRYFLVGILCAICVSTPVSLLYVRQEGRVRRLHEDLASAYRHLERSARTDQMTGIANRETFIARANEKLARGSGWLILADVDRFKAINDLHGHATGDRVLAAIGSAIRKCVRESDLCGRLGGEEFGVLIETDDPEAALATAERLRLCISALGLPDNDGVLVHPTISLGFTRARAGELARAMHEADEAMYEAKRSGRNRTVRHGFIRPRPRLKAV